MAPAVPAAPIVAAVPAATTATTVPAAAAAAATTTAVTTTATATATASAATTATTPAMGVGGGDERSGHERRGCDGEGTEEQHPGQAGRRGEKRVHGRLLMTPRGRDGDRRRADRLPDAAMRVSAAFATGFATGVPEGKACRINRLMFRRGWKGKGWGRPPGGQHPGVGVLAQAPEGAPARN
jgi:hypothetical protein